MNKLFNKIAVAFVGMAMAIGVGVAVGGKADVKPVFATLSEDPIYTLDCPKNTTNSDYNETYDVEIDDVTWRAPGNQLDDGDWRIGQKKNSAASGLDRVIYSKTVISENVGKIIVTYGSQIGTITVNSATIFIYDTAAKAAAGTADTEYDSVSFGYTASSTKNITPSAGKNWSGMYYRFVWNITSSSTTKARAISLASIDFYEIIPTFTVAYDKNDVNASGDMSSSCGTYDRGTTITVALNSFTAPSGKMFSKWNTASNGGGVDYAPAATFSLNANTTLYAQWVDLPASPFISPAKLATSGYTGQNESLSFTYGNLNGTLNVVSTDTTKVTVGEPSYSAGSGTVQINFAVATVSAVRVNFKDGETTLGYCDVTVNQTTITGLPSTKSVRMGDTLDLGDLVTAIPSGLTWVSSAPGKASVNSSGVVTPVALGETVITATSTVDAGVSATCTVTVLKALLLGTDSIARSDLDFGEETSGYQPFTASKTTKATYAGNAYVGSGTTDTTFIQIRVKGSCEGLVTTKSGGRRVKSVTLSFNKTSNSVQIYGKNTAYTSSDASDLYDAGKQGTLVTTLAYSASDVSYNFTADYKYIGFKTVDGTAYLDSISIVWEQYDAEDAAAEIKTMSGGWNNNVSTGDCNDHYKAAKEMILTLSDTQLANFTSDSASAEIKSAKATYEHWCSVNGDANPYSGAIVSPASRITGLPLNEADNSTTLVIIVISSISLIAIGGFFFIRKRKEN